jgi:hypothetical protein
MPVITHSTTGTWTEVLQTSERAVCTDGCEKHETGTDMSHPINCDQGVQIVPNQTDKNTNTGPVNVREQKSQTLINGNRIWGTSFFITEYQFVCFCRRIDHTYL